MMNAGNFTPNQRASPSETHRVAFSRLQQHTAAASRKAALDPQTPIQRKQQQCLHSTEQQQFQLHAVTKRQTDSSNPTEGPPDLMPHVLLTLESNWFNICSSNSSHQDVPSEEQQQQQQQQQSLEPCLVPRTIARLQHVDLPGYISRPRACKDLLVSSWNQQTAVAWHTAAAWAQKQQQRSLAIQQQQEQQQTSSTRPPQQQQQQPSQRVVTQQQAASNYTGDSWLQQVVHSGQGHWGPVAAVLQAYGPGLDLNQLLYITDTLVNMVGETGGVDADILSSSSMGRSSSSSSISEGPADMFQLSIIALDVPVGSRTSDLSERNAAPQQQRIHSSSSSSSTTVPGRRSGSGVVLKCACVLPQLTALLLQQLQHQIELQHSEQQQQQHSDQCTQPAAISHSRAVQLLQQVAQLHSMKQLGNVDSDFVTELLQKHISLQQCNFRDLAHIISCAGRLSQPLRASWLRGFVAAAVNAMQQQQQQQQQQVDVADVALMLDGMSMYPGPHIQHHQLSSFLYCSQADLPNLSALQLNQLLIATASLSIQPHTPWLQAAAAAAQHKFAHCSFPELVLLLQGITAAAAAADSEQYEVDDSWWQMWFEASAGRFAAVSLAAAAAGLQGSSSNSSSSRMAGSALTYANADGSSSNSNSGVVDEAYAPDGLLQDVDDMFEQLSVEGSGSTNGGKQQQQQRRQQECISASVLFDALLVFVQVKREVHPLWLAGALEAYHRSGYNAGRTPQLLLLVSDLLDNPSAFAVRHKTLLHQLMQPLQKQLAELTPEQLAQAAEACVVFKLNLGVEWFRWHSAAILRLNITFPLQPLARIADAYTKLQIVPDDHRLQQLFKSLSWRLLRQQRRAKAQARLERLRATITFKNEQRRRQNLRDKEALEKKKLKWQRRDAQKWGVGGTGMPAAGPGPEGKAQWRKRKLKPPGTLDRKY